MLYQWVKEKRLMNYKIINFVLKKGCIYLSFYILSVISFTTIKYLSYIYLLYINCFKLFFFYSINIFKSIQFIYKIMGVTKVKIINYIRCIRSYTYI